MGQDVTETTNIISEFILHIQDSDHSNFTFDLLKFIHSLKNISGNTEINNPEWELSEKGFRKPKHC